MFKLMGAALGFAACLFLTAFAANAHTRQKVHDMLHNYGYDRVVFQHEYGDAYGKPNYQFRACRGRRAFILNVDWYGHIINRERVGRCYVDSQSYSRRRDW